MPEALRMKSHTIRLKREVVTALNKVLVKHDCDFSLHVSSRGYMLVSGESVQSAQEVDVVNVEDWLYALIQATPYDIDPALAHDIERLLQEYGRDAIEAHVALSRGTLASLFIKLPPHNVVDCSVCDRRR